jgi:hypothetical protein
VAWTIVLLPIHGFSIDGTGLPKWELLKGPPMVRYFISATQFHVNVKGLLKPSNCSVQFAALSVVQGSAFGMMFRRECPINHSQGLFLYAMVLTSIWNACGCGRSTREGDNLCRCGDRQRSSHDTDRSKAQQVHTVVLRFFGDFADR